MLTSTTPGAQHYGEDKDDEKADKNDDKVYWMGALTLQLRYRSSKMQHTFLVRKSASTPTTGIDSPGHQRLQAQIRPSMPRRAAEGSQAAQQHQHDQEWRHETAQPSIVTPIMLQVGRRRLAALAFAAMRRTTPLAVRFFLSIDSDGRYISRPGLLDDRYR